MTNLWYKRCTLLRYCWTRAFFLLTVRLLVFGASTVDMYVVWAWLIRQPLQSFFRQESWCDENRFSPHVYFPEPSWSLLPYMIWFICEFCVGVGYVYVCFVYVSVCVWVFVCVCLFLFFPFFLFSITVAGLFVGLVWLVLFIFVVLCGAGRKSLSLLACLVVNGGFYLVLLLLLL